MILFAPTHKHIDLSYLNVNLISWFAFSHFRGVVIKFRFVFCIGDTTILSTSFEFIIAGSVTEQIMLLENIGTSVLVSKIQVCTYSTICRKTSILFDLYMKYPMEKKRWLKFHTLTMFLLEFIIPSFCYLGM